MSFPWGFLALVVFPLLQLPVIVYLVRRMDRDDSPSSRSSPSPRSPYGHVHPDDPDPTGSPAGPSEQAPPEIPARSRATCRGCGTENDPGFRYCRDCAGRL